MNPKVSVLMSVYNEEKYVAETIESILRQTFADFELLITDDGSTDSSLTIIESYAQRDSRIRVAHNHTNIGQGNTRNRMFEIARGEYFAVADANDIYREERLALQVEYLDTHPEIGVVGSWIQRLGSHQVFLTPPIEDYDIKSLMLIQTTLPHTTVMLRSHLVGPGRLQYNDDKYRYAEDQKLFIDACAVTRFAVLPQILVDYRVHQQGVSVKHAAEQQQTAQRIVTNQLAHYHITLPSNLYKYFDARSMFASTIFMSLKDVLMTARVTKEIINIRSFYGYNGVSSRFKSFLRSRFCRRLVYTALTLMRIDRAAKKMLYYYRKNIGGKIPAIHNLVMRPHKRFTQDRNRY